jgi:hypothetical protein
VSICLFVLLIAIPTRFRSSPLTFATSARARKYGTDNDVDAAAKRFMLWQSWNGMGLMLRRGMIEAEDLYDIGGSMVVMHWKKWEPIVQEIRRRYWGSDYLKDFEYLNDEMMKIKIMRDSSYKVPETFFKYVPDK